MSKLSLKQFKLREDNILRRDDLKLVFGGDELPACAQKAFLTGVQAENAGYSAEQVEWYVQCSYAVECYGYSVEDCYG